VGTGAVSRRSQGGRIRWSTMSMIKATITKAKQDPRLRGVARRIALPLAVPIVHRLDARYGRGGAHDPVMGPESQQLLAQIPALLSAVSAQNAAARELTRKQAELLAAIEVVRGVDQRTEAIEGAIRAVQAQLVEAWAVEAQLAEDVKWLDQRLAFVRREVLNEVQHGGSSPASARPSTEVKVLSPDKLKASPLRLNLGCGHVMLDGYVNIDARELPGVDVVADLRSLPIDEGTVDEIYAAHVIEHFSDEEIDRFLLPHWRSLLAPGGVVRIVVPDAEAMLQRHADADMTFDELRLVTFGDQEYSLDYHFTMFSPSSLAATLERHGFERVEVVAAARRNGLCSEMELIGSVAQDAPSRAS
jgi:hypothetical protein